MRIFILYFFTYSSEHCEPVCVFSYSIYLYIDTHIVSRCAYFHIIFIYVFLCLFRADVRIILLYLFTYLSEHCDRPCRCMDLTCSIKLYIYRCHNMMYNRHCLICCIF